MHFFVNIHIYCLFANTRRFVISTEHALNGTYACLGSPVGSLKVRETERHAAKYQSMLVNEILIFEWFLVQSVVLAFSVTQSSQSRSKISDICYKT